MHFDDSVPVAVFLGPSLPLEQARAILPANYYPPVRMGDIYRLLSSGVEHIVIIDGVFHETTPVWQREILAALDKGIVVLGASSMGALRAAELADFGMRGVGQIAHWYRTGYIDGDDEVALLHADEMLGYIGVSEPLVNIRHNLARAVDADVVEAHEADALIEAMKQRYFAERSFQALTDCAVLSEDKHKALQTFLGHSKQDLKALDAALALEHCAGLRSEASSVDDENPQPGAVKRFEHTAFAAIEGLQRGLLRLDGELVQAQTVLAEASADQALVSSAWMRCSTDFYLLERARELDVTVDEEVRTAVLRSTAMPSDADERSRWLRRVGLTEQEFEHALERRALVETLRVTEPKHFGLDIELHLSCIEGLQSWYRQQGIEPLSKQVMLAGTIDGLHVNEWAERGGIVAPEAEVSGFLSRWEADAGVCDRGALLGHLGIDEPTYRQLWGQRALFHWMVTKGPVYFGYQTYSFDFELLRALQLDGRILNYVASIESA